MPEEQIFEDLEAECKRIDKLYEEYEPLLEKVKDREPDFIELGSLAIMLHSFITGLKIFLAVLPGKSIKRYL